jgi:hypothetical protein
LSDPVDNRLDILAQRSTLFLSHSHSHSRSHSLTLTLTYTLSLSLPLPPSPSPSLLFCLSPSLAFSLSPSLFSTLSPSPSLSLSLAHSLALALALSLSFSLLLSLSLSQILSTPASLASPAAAFESLEARRHYFRHVICLSPPLSTSPSPPMRVFRCVMFTYNTTRTHARSLIRSRTHARAHTQPLCSSPSSLSSLAYSLSLPAVCVETSGARRNFYSMCICVFLYTPRHINRLQYISICLTIYNI